MKIENYFLTEGLDGRRVKKLHCDKQSEHLVCPDTIVLHYTAGGNGMSSAHYLARADTDVSAHLVIARDGSIIQVLPFDTVAWHAGRSKHHGRENLNQCSIGIELDNAGELHRRENRFFSWFNREYMPDDVYTNVVNGRAKYWHRYTEEQLNACFAVCMALYRNFPIRYLVRHSDITNRKLDPGPAFPFKDFVEQIERMRVEG